MEGSQIRYHITDNYVARSIAGETVLVPVGEQVKKLNGYITFTESGQFLWNLISQKRCTAEDLARELAREYGKSQDDVQEDVTAFLDKAVHNDLIVRDGA